MAPSRPKDERRSNIVGEDQNSRVSIRASCHSQPDLKTTFKLLSDQTLAPLRHTKAHSALRDLKNVAVEDFLASNTEASFSVTKLKQMMIALFLICLLSLIWILRGNYDFRRILFFNPFPAWEVTQFYLGTSILFV